MFQGFSQDTVDFLWGIRFNNERSWFNAHKQDYLTHLYEPMKELGAQVQDIMISRFPDSQLNLKVSRIYRDARRLYGRGPYKDHLWLSLFRWEGGEDGGHPVFWFELTPDGYSYGMGFWCAKAVMAEKHRARIDADPAPLLALHRLLATQDRLVLTGPEYARKKVCREEELTAWYNKKSLAVSFDSPLTEELYSPDLAQTLADAFTFLMPFYDYFSTIWADADPREAH